MTPASFVTKISDFEDFSCDGCGLAVTVRRSTSGMSSFLPLEPDRILEMVGMLRELGTKSVKFAWSFP